jgi:Ca2+-binding EF-hand superfamily protein
MFDKFDEDKQESLTLDQFQKYLYAIGMEFINKKYNSGKGNLFYT